MDRKKIDREFKKLRFGKMPLLFLFRLIRDLPISHSKIQMLKLYVLDHYSSIALKLHCVPSIPIFHDRWLDTRSEIHYFKTKR